MFHPEKSASAKRARKIFETSLPNDITISLKSTYNRLNKRIGFRETFDANRLNTLTISRKIGNSLKSTYNKLSEKFNLKEESSDKTSLNNSAEDVKDNDFSCPNKDCGQVFSRPLEALNIQKEGPTKYYACPNCLTEIIFEQDLELQEESTNFQVKKEFEPEPELETEQISPNEESAGCRHHIGYLSERESKDSIPDECMMCKDIINCMLKKVNQ